MIYMILVYLSHLVFLKFWYHQRYYFQHTLMFDYRSSLIAIMVNVAVNYHFKVASSW